MFSSKSFHSSPRIFFSAFILVFLLSGISYSEERSSTIPLQPDKITGEYIKGYVTDTANMVASPAQWDRNNWLNAGLVVGATSGIYLADASIRTFAQRNQSSAGDNFAGIGNTIGNPFFILPPLGLFYLYGHLYDDPKVRRTTLLAVESLAISGAFTVMVKTATQRPRPSTGKTATEWDGPGLNNSDPSFPSNHTAAAFSVASVLAEEYSTNSYVPPIAYGLASLTACARIYDNKHWASDAFFGGAIGFFVGKAVVRYHTSNSTDLKIMPAISQQGFRLTADYRF